MKPEMSFVSVTAIIPAFRAQDTIEKAVESIAQQTVLPREVIIVNDGSDDATEETIKTIVKRHPKNWIKYIHFEENQGVASARNAGWDLASCEYIAFLDADDVWHPRKIEIQYGFMSRDDNLVLSGHEHIISQNLSHANIIPGMDFVHKKIGRQSILISNPFVTPSVMLRRAIPFRFLPGKRHMEDHLLWAEIVLSGFKAAKIFLPLATIGKPLYGIRGLSAQMWEMEKGDLKNYQYLQKKGYIGKIASIFLMVLSLLKYIRRLLVVFQKNWHDDVHRTGRTSKPIAQEHTLSHPPRHP